MGPQAALGTRRVLHLRAVRAWPDPDAPMVRAGACERVGAPGREARAHQPAGDAHHQLAARDRRRALARPRRGLGRTGWVRVPEGVRGDVRLAADARRHHRRDGPPPHAALPGAQCARRVPAQHGGGRGQGRSGAVRVRRHVGRLPGQGDRAADGGRLGGVRAVEGRGLRAVALAVGLPLRAGLAQPRGGRQDPRWVVPAQRGGP
mmetsp:Transcript_18129/g.46427  ORF Transcript_18129/g.46427 Transcript_18129/m.46427 type:complete len:205 (+) Transcript_18129:1190-1804(+)